MLSSPCVTFKLCLLSTSSSTTRWQLYATSVKHHLHGGDDRWEAVERSKWSDLSTISQRAAKHYPAIAKISHGLSMIIQWSPWSPWSPQSFDSAQNNLNDHQRKWSLNEHSMNVHWMLKENLTISSSSTISSILMIFQWSFVEPQICPPQRRDGWEINEHTRISPRNGFFIAFERSLRIGPIFDRSMVA